MDKQYDPSWQSLRNHRTPRWLRESKFGIYTHWGIYSVPACGPNGTWYAYNMYRPGNSQHDHHKKTFGGASAFGYKDFIPRFTAEKFDADEWAELFKSAGAGFAGPVAEHHDGFSLWDSTVNEWNAARMGPKRDVVGELEKAIRGQGMRFMTAFHHFEQWWFYPHWRSDCDVFDPRFAGLYGPMHNLDGLGDDADNRRGDWLLQDRPDGKFHDFWRAKIDEVVETYRPDLMWFDFGLNFVQEVPWLARGDLHDQIAQAIERRGDSLGHHVGLRSAPGVAPRQQRTRDPETESQALRPGLRLQDREK